MATADLLLRGGLVLVGPGRPPLPRDILVRKGRIAALEPRLVAAPGTEVIEAHGLLVHAGLVNAHTHSSATLSRGLTGRWTLEMLLAASPWLNSDRGVEMLRLAATLCAAEQALGGCTSVFDMPTLPRVTAEAIDAVAAGFAEVGIRAVVAPGVADEGLGSGAPELADLLEEPAPEHARRRAAESLTELRRAAAGWSRGSAGITLGIAPTIPGHCSDGYLDDLTRLARDHGLRRQTHLAESRTQALLGRRRYGVSITRHLHRRGLLGEDLLAAHAIWVGSDDLALLADAGVTVVHCPGSNLRLGSGIFAMVRAQAANVRVAIGSDGATCSDTGSMYEAMRTASRLSRLCDPDPHGWADSAQVLAAGTSAGSVAVGTPTGTGLPSGIAVGAPADLALLDLSHPAWTPLNDATEQLVHAETGAALRHLVVDGRVVVRDRRLTTVDPARLADRAARARDELAESTQLLRRRIERRMPAVTAAVADLTAHLEEDADADDAP